MIACQIGRLTTEKLFSYMEGRGDHRLIVPMFQRNICWKEDQEDCFIDSLAKGYPVGSMLFHETDMNGGKAYVLIDGLQRCDTIKKHMRKPFPFISQRENSHRTCAQSCAASSLWTMRKIKSAR